MAETETADQLDPLAQEEKTRQMLLLKITIFSLTWFI